MDHRYFVHTAIEKDNKQPSICQHTAGTTKIIDSIEVDMENLERIQEWSQSYFQYKKIE